MQIKLPYKLSLSYKHTIYIANTPGSLSGMLSNRPTETEVFFLFGMRDVTRTLTFHGAVTFFQQWERL